MSPPSPPPPPPKKGLAIEASLVGYGLLCLHALCFGGLVVVAPWHYYRLVAEDAWVENLTAVWFLLAGCLLCATAGAVRSSFRRGVYVLGGLALLFVAGEEISWGQRIFGLETPAFLWDLNAQNELNVHNIRTAWFTQVSMRFTQVSLDSLLLLSMVTGAAVCCRQDRLFGFPLPSVLLMLGFLVTLAYRPVSNMAIPDFLFHREKALLLFFVLFAGFAGPARQFMAAAATLALVLAFSYVNQYAPFGAGKIWEVHEYLFGMVCLAYAGELWLAREPRAAFARTRGMGRTLAAAWPWEVPSIWMAWDGRRAGANGWIPRLPWLTTCALVVVGSIGLAALGHFHVRATAAINAELYRAIMSGAAGEPIIRSRFDVYLIENRLVYIKEPCTAADMEPAFFVHVIPVAMNDLPAARRRYGFENRDFYWRGERFTGQCIAHVRLPKYAITGIRTGQYIWGEGGEDRIWLEHVVVNRGVFQTAYAAAVSGRPVVRAHFDVYVDVDRLIYIKEPCSLEDTGPTFFVHVDPVDPGDLSPYRKHYGFDNLDFPFGAYGAFLDNGSCVAVRSLPDYAIAAVRTGQFVPDAGRTWQETILWEP